MPARWLEPAIIIPGGIARAVSAMVGTEDAARMKLEPMAASLLAAPSGVLGSSGTLGGGFAGLLSG